MGDLSKSPKVAGSRSDLVGSQSEGVDDKRDQETEQVNPVPAMQICTQGAYNAILLVTGSWVGRGDQDQKLLARRARRLGALLWLLLDRVHHRPVHKLLEFSKGRGAWWAARLPSDRPGGLRRPVWGGR